MNSLSFRSFQGDQATCNFRYRLRRRSEKSWTDVFLERQRKPSDVANGAWMTWFGNRTEPVIADYFAIALWKDSKNQRRWTVVVFKIQNRNPTIKLKTIKTIFEDVNYFYEYGTVFFRLFEDDLSVFLRVLCELMSYLIFPTTFILAFFRMKLYPEQMPLYSLVFAFKKYFTIRRLFLRLTLWSVCRFL